MAEGKWISDLKPEAPLAEAARHVLSVRLHVVTDYLPRAALEADRDIEFVHQLRVGTRRADAALRIFEMCLTSKAHRKARRRLKQLRRAAGAARDWDVFLTDLLAREGTADARHRRNRLPHRLRHRSARRRSRRAGTSVSRAGADP